MVVLPHTNQKQCTDDDAWVILWSDSWSLSMKWLVGWWITKEPKHHAFLSPSKFKLVDLMGGLMSLILQHFSQAAFPQIIAWFSPYYFETWLDMHFSCCLPCDASLALQLKTGKDPNTLPKIPIYLLPSTFLLILLSAFLIASHYLFPYWSVPDHTCTDTTTIVCSLLFREIYKTTRLLL